MQLATKKALLASIEHWRELEQAKSFYDVQLGPDQCALCQRFGYPCERTIQKTTERCPVYKSTGLKSCRGSPFSDADCASEDEDLHAFRAAARREREFLESLLPSPTK
jgi:hypothetical protein